MKKKLNKQKTFLFPCIRTSRRLVEQDTVVRGYAHIMKKKMEYSGNCCRYSHSVVLKGRGSVKLKKFLFLTLSDHIAFA